MCVCVAKIKLPYLAGYSTLLVSLTGRQVLHLGGRLNNNQLASIAVFVDNRVALRTQWWPFFVNLYLLFSLRGKLALVLRFGGGKHEHHVSRFPLAYSFVPHTSSVFIRSSSLVSQSRVG